jgi:hypothetical protein
MLGVKVENLDRCHTFPSVLAVQAQFMQLKWKVVALESNSGESLPGARTSDVPYIPVTCRLIT